MPISLQREIAESLSHVLLSYAAHGLATETLVGLGEISLRDGLVVGAAAVGARRNAAWIIGREYAPPEWTGGNIDLAIWRKRQKRKHLFCVAELKWWHQDDSSNAANRRAKLARDFLRAGSMYPRLTGEDKTALILLLTTRASWATTVNDHCGSDSPLCVDWRRIYGERSWNVRQLSGCPAIRSAVKELDGLGVSIPNIIHIQLAFAVSVKLQRTESVFVRCWIVRKPQNTVFLNQADIQQISSK